MIFESAIARSRHLSPLILPDLNRLSSAKKRVFVRWPDVVPDAPEKDHEIIISQMLDLLRTNDWRDIKLSFVLRAFKVAFNPKFRIRPDVLEILNFAYAELDATTQTTFLNSMVSIYISSYEPNAKHSLNLGRKIQSKHELLNGKWRVILEKYATFFNGQNSHITIANSMVQMDSPWAGLKNQGFTDPHATGLMEFVHIEYIDCLQPKLKDEIWLNKLFSWLNPKNGKPKQSNSIMVIEAILIHWLKQRPDDQLRQLITENLINQYNDPRINKALWAGVREDCMNVIFSWLTREKLRFFTSVVDATQKDPQWQPRKKFWLQLYDEGLIEQAWVAFCPSAERYARRHLVRTETSNNVTLFARQIKGSSRSNTSILLMKIGNKIVVDGCHNYRTHMFNIDDPLAPRLDLKEYDCDADVMNLAPHSKGHYPIPHWRDWVRESLSIKIPMSKKRKWSLYDKD